MSGAAAAYWHGLLDRAPDVVEVTVPRRCAPGGRPDVRVRRRDLLAVDRTATRHLWSTAVPLTVLETAVTLRDGSTFLDRALPPEQRVAVEVDGWAWHVDPQRFRADRRKQNALVRAGWDPLRFTWHDLDQRPAAVLAEIRETLQGN